MEESKGEIRRILFFLKPFRKRITLSILLTGFLTALGMLPPLFIRSLIDNVVGQSQWKLFVWITLGLLLAPIIREFINVINGVSS